MRLTFSKWATLQCAIFIVGALALGMVSACNFRYEKDSGAKGGDSTFAQVESVGFDRVNAEIFLPKCASCHAQKEPILNSYETIVANLRNIEDSVLVKKSMPKREPLAENLQALLRSWIADGAPREVGQSKLPVVPEETAIPRPYTFASLKKDVLARNCNGCHFVGNADGITELETFESTYSVKEFILPLVMGFDGKEAVPDEVRMPPLTAPQPSEGEKLRLLLWFQDGNLDTVAPAAPSESSGEKK